MSTHQMYIRKNHLTINETPEIYEIVSEEDGCVYNFGTELALNELLNTEVWGVGDIVILDYDTNNYTVVQN